MNGAPPPRVAVIGGGIAGLTAAYRLGRRGIPTVVLEREGRLGGKILTERLRGGIVEGGPDAFLAQKPEGTALCAELGVELVPAAPAPTRALIMRDGVLHPLPDGLSGVSPTRPWSLLRTPLLAPRARVRAGLEPLVRRRRGSGDESIAGFFSRRLGRGAWEGLVEPLVTGMYAGDGDRMSLAATFPMFRAAEERGGGLMRSARSRPGAVSFVSPRGGMGSIVEALVAQTPAGQVRTGVTVTAVARSGDGYRVDIADAGPLQVDAVVVAAPPQAAAGLVDSLDGELAELLRGIPYVSTAVVALGFPAEAIPAGVDVHGYVLPRREGSPIVACAFASNKFPHTDPPGLFVVRGFVGRAGEPDPLARSDRELVDEIRGELARSLGLRAEPVLVRVHRWPDALPNYPVGQLERWAAIDRRLRGFPGLALAGSGMRGIGIPDCIGSGTAAAERVARAVGVPETATADCEPAGSDKGIGS